MFYYRTIFSKKAVFLEKTAKNLFVRGHGRFEGRGQLATKINITFFVGFDVLNIFYLTTFSKRKHIFQNISEKLFLMDVTIFEGTGGRTTKMNITFFLVNGYQIQFLSFFLKKPHTV